MRILLTVFLSFVLTVGATASAQDVSPEARQQNADALLRVKMLALLEAHPDQDAVSALKVDIESNKLRLGDIGGDARPNLQEELRSTVIAFDYLFAVVSRDYPQDDWSVPIFASFFALDSCSQRVSLQAFGLFYRYLLKPEVTDYLRQRQLHEEAMDRGEEAPFENEWEERLWLLNNGEALIVDNIDQFSRLVFTECRAEDIQSALQEIGANNLPVTDAKLFADAVKQAVGKSIAEHREYAQKEMQRKIERLEKSATP